MINNQDASGRGAGLETVLARDAAPDIGRLKAYTQAKQALAREIRALRRLFADQKRETAVAQCQELMVKLAEDRFTLAVLGQFKRGKSSLMNAIIGRDLLPTGVLPLTSAITILRFGPRERLIINSRDHHFPMEEPVTRLAAFVTEEGNPGNAKAVRSAVIEVPVPFLRRGVEFVDTPGVGSSIDANTATTYEFLPQCDAVLLVISVEAPVTKTEVEFLAASRTHVRPVFFVVNKIDLVSDAERESVLAFVEKALRQHTEVQTIRLFPVSSRLALSAKQQGDAEGYAKSGLKALEEALAEFLSAQKAATLLVAVADKAIRIIDEARRARVSPSVCAADSLASADAQALAVVKRLERFRLQWLSQTWEPPAPIPFERVEEAPPAAVPAPPEAAESALNLRTRGCPVCGRMGEAAFLFIARWQNALATDERTQQAFAADLGFCPPHTWQLVALASPQGLSLGYPLLAERQAETLRRLARQPSGAAGALRASLPRTPTCRMCRHLDEVQTDTVRQLAELLQTPAGREAYAASQGVCLRHLALLIAPPADEDLLRFCLAHAARRFDEASEDMQNFAMKHDALRRALHNRDEEDAYLRAVIHLVGEKSAWLWDDDREL